VIKGAEKTSKSKMEDQSNKEIKIKTNNKLDKGKTKSQRKKFLLIIPVIVIICIIGFVWFVQTPDVVKAQLVIDSGTVQVKHSGESWISGESGMLLYQSDLVKTGNDTYASIILFESSIIRLDSNTEITLKEIITDAGRTSVTIQQDAGRTWNTVLKVSGIDDYEVQTPTTIASIRGTSFDVYIKVDNITDVGVGSGIVIVSKIYKNKIVDSIELKMNQVTSIYGNKFNQILKIVEFLIDDWVLKNQQEDQDLKYDVKEDLYERIDPYIPEIKERWGVTDEELDVLVEGYINGNFDLPPETPDWIKDLMELS
jgi:hypothetical protein